MPELPKELTDLSPIRENQRFATFEARYRGERVFAKQAKDPELAESIQHEINGLQIFDELATTHELNFAVPRLLLHGTDFVVTSWAAGKPMGLDDAAAATPEEIEFFAQAFVAIDRFGQVEEDRKPLFNLQTQSADESVSVLRERLAAVDYPDYIDPKIFKDGFEYIEASLDQLESRLAHADVNPSNILEAAGVRTLVDYEFTNTAWPRFYDLVNLTSSRIVLFPEIAASMRQLVRRYFEVNDGVSTDDSMVQLNVVAMYRSMSLAWELITEPNQHHNTMQQMSPEIYGRLAKMVKTILGGELYSESI